MTFNEMVTEAELLYESINSSDAPGFTNEEWGQLFTIAQRKIVLRILQDGVSKNTFNQQAITALIRSDSYVTANFENDDHFTNVNGTFAKRLKSSVAFESKFFWILDEYVNTATTTNIPIKRITYDFYRINLRNPYRWPDVAEGFWLLVYNTVDPLVATTLVPIIITDGTTITNYNLIGVYHPDNYPIVSGTTYPDAAHGGTQASCLNLSVHPMIVEEAVMLARMSMTDQAGYQLAAAEFAK